MRPIEHKGDNAQQPFTNSDKKHPLTLVFTP
jgi:hypothetical protein